MFFHLNDPIEFNFEEEEKIEYLITQAYNKMKESPNLKTKEAFES